MQFSDITGAIHDAWTFLWPPFLMILIAFLCSKLINPEGTNTALTLVWESLKGAADKFEAIRKVFDVYGLSKLVPLTSLVAVISLLYLLNGPITIFSSKLPPHFSYIPSVIVERSGNDELLLLLRKYPTSDSVGQAYSFAQDELLSQPSYKHNKYDRVQLHYKIQNFIKFAIICLIFFSILHLAHGAGVFSVFTRFIAGFVLIAGIWVIALVPLLYNQEQSFYDDWRKIQISLQHEATDLLKEPASEEELGILDRTTRGERWWRLHFIDTGMIEWARRNLIGNTM